MSVETIDTIGLILLVIVGGIAAYHRPKLKKKIEAGYGSVKDHTRVKAYWYLELASYVAAFSLGFMHGDWIRSFF